MKRAGKTKAAGGSKTLVARFRPRGRRVRGCRGGDTASGPAAEVRDELMQSISGQIAVRIRAYYIQRRLRPPAQSAELLASMLAGIAIHGGRQALALALPPADVGVFATALAHAGLQHLAPDRMEAIDELG